MMEKKKSQYLTPMIKVVSFTIEGGFQASQPEPEVIQTSKASEYGNYGYNDWGTINN